MFYIVCFTRECFSTFDVLLLYVSILIITYSAAERSDGAS